jgi:hypothetical protein
VLPLVLGHCDAVLRACRRAVSRDAKGFEKLDEETRTALHGPGPPARLSALSIPHSKSGLNGGFGWARLALNNQKTVVPDKDQKAHLASEFGVLR